MTDVVEKGYLEAQKRARTRQRLDDALALIRDDWKRAQLPPAREQMLRHAVPDSKPPTDVTVLSVLDGCQRALRRWTAVVVSERHVTVRHGSLASFLLLHTEWLAAHERADDCVRDIERHAQLVHALALGSRLSFVDVGACPEHQCSGRLTAIIRKADNGMLPDRVICSHDSEHSWEPWQWPNLGRRIVGELDPDGVARLMRQLNIKHTA